VSVLIDYDFATGTQRHLHEHAGEITIQTAQDVEPILELNAQQRKEFDKHARYGGDGGTQHHIGRIPMFIFMKLHKRGILKDQRKLKKWLNGEGKIWRTREGTV